MANPTYPQITITPNLGLNLTGMDVVIALDFLILDTFLGSLPLGPFLETNGAPNTLQTTLNLIAGANITLVSDVFGGVTINSTGGSSSQNPVFKSSAYLAVANDLVLCDTSGGGFTVTLPLSAVNKGLSINVKKISSDHNTLTIATSGADTIDEGPAVSTYQPNTNVTFTGDGITNWGIE